MNARVSFKLRNHAIEKAWVSDSFLPPLHLSPEHGCGGGVGICNIFDEQEADQRVFRDNRSKIYMGISLPVMPPISFLRGNFRFSFNSHPPPPKKILIR